MVREPFNALSHALGVPLALLGGLLLLLLAPREAWPTLPTLALMALSGPSYTLGAWATEPSAPTPGPGGWASTGCGTSSSSWEASLCTWRS
ncbi:hypothetical protein TthAA22_16000 [Thermus thermophilus]|nr:hypothetical protein [Thermus thermophilus]BCZ89795.1 hypothetical protein TthAA22_16000 [Thermus thermophilus]